MGNRETSTQCPNPEKSIQVHTENELKITSVGLNEPGLTGVKGFAAKTKQPFRFWIGGG